jgi:septal ring factor EnvC (AmiA/AmiB activator)
MFYFYGQVSQVAVKPGQLVETGQVIGDLTLSNDGNRLLLFSVYKNGNEINEEQQIDHN